MTLDVYIYDLPEYLYSYVFIRLAEYMSTSTCTSIYELSHLYQDSLDIPVYLSIISHEYHDEYLYGHGYQ